METLKMMNTVRKFLGVATVALTCLTPLTAKAQGAYPQKPIRVIVGVAPGGLIDRSARLITTQLSARLGQPILVDNRPGAATTIAANTVLNAEPDGYTFFYGGAMSASPIFVKNGAVDFVSQMKPVSQTLSAPFYLLVSTKVPANTIQDLVAYSKQNPGKLNQADISPASTMVLHAIAERSGLDFTPIPYKGSAPALRALIAGEVDMVLDTVPNYVPHINTGKVRAIMNTGRARMPQLPDVPFGLETKAIDFTTGSMFGLWAPSGTPDAIIKRVSDEIAALSKDSAFVAKFREATHVDPLGSTPAELLKVVEADKALYERVAKRTGHQPQ
jgi:tripartite-type tricarboxylate transporter receptor subunit TctC